MLLVLNGCASTSTSINTVASINITALNNNISMPSYSFVVPPNDDWQLIKGNPQSEELFLINTIADMVEFRVRLIHAPIPPELTRESAKYAADDYRNNEKNILILEGVEKGMYELKNIKMGEEIIGDKKFYTMTYNNRTKDFSQASRLYLYFPKEYGNEYFLLALYTESVNNNITMAYKSKEKEFKEMLKSLVLVK